MESVLNLSSETIRSSLPTALRDLELGNVPYVTIALASIGFYLLNQSLKGKRNNVPFPPGPPADPIIGHLRLIPSTNPADTFQEWNKTYGDVIHLRALGRNVIVLGSLEAAHDLLNKKGSKYSCRPQKIATFEILGWMDCLPFLPYGKHFFKIRRLVQTLLGHQEMLAYNPIQIEEARALTRSIATTKNEHEFYLSKFISAIIARIDMGYKISSNDDALLKVIEDQAHATTSVGTPGSTPVDIFPWLRYFPSWFPGAYYGAKARELSGAVQKIHEYPVEVVQKQIADGSAQDSFILDQLQNLTAPENTGSSVEHFNSAITFNDIQCASASMFGAGIDTTSGTITIFLMMMLLHPEMQRRAQEEIDSVVGKDRLPEYTDRESLPYLESLLQETLRWFPVIPLGLPHISTEDDIYKGMYIPKGSFVIGNIRGMSRDEKTYTEPEKFNPLRFLPKPEGLGEPYFTGLWGFGRRICPGRFLAETSIWIAMATILATVDVLQDLDENGKEIVLDGALQNETISRPVPFKCRFVPRDSRYKMIEDTI